MGSVFTPYGLQLMTSALTQPVIPTIVELHIGTLSAAQMYDASTVTPTPTAIKDTSPSVFTALTNQPIAATAVISITASNITNTDVQIDEVGLMVADGGTRHAVIIDADVAGRGVIPANTDRVLTFAWQVTGDGSTPSVNVTVSEVISATNKQVEDALSGTAPHATVAGNLVSLGNIYANRTKFTVPDMASSADVDAGTLDNKAIPPASLADSSYRPIYLSDSAPSNSTGNNGDMWVRQSGDIGVYVKVSGRWIRVTRGNPPNASTTTKGLVELATTSEDKAGTSGTLASTPQGVKATIADAITEAINGIFVEYADEDSLPDTVPAGQVAYVAED